LLTACLAVVTSGARIAQFPDRATAAAPLALRVQDNNTPAIALYERLGFLPS
jgi:ribosomal protein S18 acetylase RimI-like enzyme